MTKFVGLVAALVAAMGVTLAAPASSEAGGFRRCRSYYVEPCCSSCCDAWSTVEAPGCSASYYPTGPVYSSGYYYPTGRVYSSGYYRVGNVIINGRRWGDIGSRYSHADLVGW
jgi:hypothetical protein